MRYLRSTAVALRVAIMVTVAGLVGAEGHWEVAAKQPRFVDNGDGTITDNLTGLQWEKKIQPPPFNVHTVDREFDDTSVRTRFLPAVNESSADGITVTGLGGHRDWRLPTIAELQTILLAPFPCVMSPCIDPIFGPTAAAFYRSSTASAFDGSDVWFVDFTDGALNHNTFGNSLAHARAVRNAR
jgi:hypothetical protein